MRPPLNVIFARIRSVDRSQGRVWFRERAAALIVVLAFLVLMTVLVIAFFGTVSVEYQASKAGSDIESGRQLAETAVQIVMGQIRTATSQSQVAWASQPGMIRTYDNTGRPLSGYALYSSAQMVRALPPGGWDPSLDLPTGSWDQQAALWVDLNAPSPRSDGGVAFPVLDPRAAGEAVAGQPLVEGFSYDAAAISGAAPASSTDDASARLPMPVRWIYVLKDGSLAVPSSATGTGVVFSAPGAVPTAANPITGRISFWADDETCKLNVNTACGGVPWDTPIGNSGLELLLARYQPAKNEYSRYPGHPATVSLLPVLWSYLGLSSPNQSLFPSFTPNWNTTQPMAAGPTLSPAATAFRDRVFPLIPRNSFGGSALSTKPTVDIRDGLAALAAVDSDRLFASPEEIAFGPGEGAATRNTNPLGIDAEEAGRLSFFLTAQSHAPEVNLFNLPKIALWPVPHHSSKSVMNSNAISGDTRSAVDRLIAFSSLLAYDNATRTREYAFTRYDATSATNDVQALDASGSAGNRILLDYLTGLLSRPLPGFGGSWEARYGSGGVRQIAANVFDYIRSQINLVDTSYSAATVTSPQNVDAGFISRYAYSGNLTGSLATEVINGEAGQVVPAQLPGGARGAGRFPVLSQIAIQFVARAANQPPVAGNPMHPWVAAGQAYPTMDLDKSGNQTASSYDAGRAGRFHTHPGLRFLTVPSTSGGSTYDVPNPRYRGPDLAAYQTQVEPVLWLSFQQPGAGVPGVRAPFRVRVRGLDNLRVGGAPIFPSYDTRVTTIGSSTQVTQNQIGPSFWPIASTLVGTPFTVGSPSDSGATFSFDGGDIVVELIQPGSNAVVQTYRLNFPAGTFPTPLLPNPLPVDDRARSRNSYWDGFFKPQFPPASAADLPPSTLLTFDATSALAAFPNSPNGVSGYAANKTRRSGAVAMANVILPQWPVASDYRGKLSSDTVRALEVAYGDARLIASLAEVPSSFFLPHRFYFDSRMRAAHTLRDVQYETFYDQLQGATLQYLTSSSDSAEATLPRYGAGWDLAHPNPGNLWDVATGKDVQRLTYNYFVAGNPVRAERWPLTASTGVFAPSEFAAYKNSSSTLSGLEAFPSVWSRGGDFSSGIPGIMDGSQLGKADEGNNRIGNRGIYPYFNELATMAIVPVGPNLFSPNRQVPSPVVLGSLPAGYKPSFDPSSPRLDATTPWRTLLFSPNPVSPSHEALSEVNGGGASVSPGHAPDFTLLDFFWMPVVEPYALSESFSTAGKVNMNAQIAPFTYITRDTALRGVLRSTFITAVPDKWINFKNSTGSGSGVLYDLGGNSASINYANFRYPINADETLRQFRARFGSGDLFRSASEICSLWLYPDSRSPSDAPLPKWDSAGQAIRDWWYANPGSESKSATGDNLREKPYSMLYPLLTTKSNTYTVHVKVQVLQKVPGTPVAEWVEGRDRVASEYQGSQTIERYIDAMDPKLTDFATSNSPADPNLGDFYRFRVISNKRFVP